MEFVAAFDSPGTQGDRRHPLVCQSKGCPVHAGKFESLLLCEYSHGVVLCCVVLRKI